MSISKLREVFKSIYDWDTEDVFLKLNKMEKLQKQLDKMLSEFKVIAKEQEKLLVETEQKIDTIPDEEQKLFFKSCIKEAKSGKLNVADFVKQVKKMTE